ncbi:MAG: alpha/beta hydrolase [Planctomycetes bacterium]|nr:alpha/beta hydrolase [Planctomycetota bacterium]
MESSAAATTTTGRGPRRRPRFVIYLLLLLTGFYLLLCGAVYLLQGWLLFPGRARERRPVEPPHGVVVEQRMRQAGQRFRVAVGTPDAVRGVAAFFLGNGEDLSNGVWVAAVLREYGLLALVAEYPGYGESEGTPSFRSLLEVADLVGAEAGRRAREHGVPLVLGGRSLGTFSAVHLAARDRTAPDDVVSRSGKQPAGRETRVVLFAPPTSIAAVARLRFPVLPTGWLLRHPFDNLGKVAEVRAPVLIVHGERDEVVPSTMGRALAEALPRATYHEVGGVGHNDLPLQRSGPTGELLARFLLQR